MRHGTREHLILVLEAPAISFGGEVIDNYGVVRDFPARSMLTGLLANALGYDRAEGERLDALQARIVHASVLARAGARSRDYQTARLFEKDAGWTARGTPEGRASSPSFTWDALYERERGERRKSLTHQRYRDFDADGAVLVALALTDADGPTLDEVADALERPERPLFIGRKPHLPARPILWRPRSPGTTDAARRERTVMAPDAVTALLTVMVAEGWPPCGRAGLRVQWSCSAGPDLAVGESATLACDGDEARLVAEARHRIGDERRHVAGVHAGTREVIEGRLHQPRSEAVANLEDPDGADALPSPTGDWSAP